MESHTDPSNLFSRHSYFQLASPGLLEQIAARSRRHIFKAEEIIFMEGDTGTSLWIVESGSVKISRIRGEGSEHILHLLGSGDSFNDIAAVDGGPTPVMATALSLAVCWALPAAALRECLASHPDLAMNVITLLSKRVRHLIDQLEELALYSVMVRLIRFLLAQADHPTLNEPGITRAAIAAHLATTPETVSRSLLKLQELGYIRFDRHRIMITDRETLRTLALL